MATFYNSGPSSILYIDMNGSSANADAGESFSSPDRHEIIHMPQVALTSEVPYIEANKFKSFAFSGAVTHVLDLDVVEILQATKITIHTTTKSMTLEIRLNAAAAPIFEKLNYNSGHTYVTIKPSRRIRAIYMTSNIAGTVYTLIGRE